MYLNFVCFKIALCACTFFSTVNRHFVALSIILTTEVAYANVKVVIYKLQFEMLKQ